MVHSFWLCLVFKWHLVELCEVFLDLKLAEEGIASEGELVWSQRLVSTCKNHLMADKVDLGARFLETRCDRWLDTLRAHILLKLQALLVVFNQLVYILLGRLGRRFKVTLVLGGQVADLLRVAQLEVDLIWVKAESFHL